MIYDLIAAVLIALAVTGLVGFLAFRMYHYKTEAKRLRERLAEVLPKDPLQLDLELATTDQLFGELRRRPQPPYVLLSPKFEPAGIDLNMEVHNLPPHIALGLLKLAHKLAARQNGPEVVEQSEDFLAEE